MIELFPNLLFATEHYIKNKNFIDSKKFANKEIYNAIKLKKIKNFLFSIDCWHSEKDMPYVLPKNLDLSLIQDIVYQYIVKNSENIKWLKFAKKGNSYLRDDMKSDFPNDHTLLSICGIYDDVLDSQTENFFNKLLILSRKASYDFHKEFQEDLEKLEKGRKGEKFSKIILEKRNREKVIQYHFEDNDKGYDLYQKVDVKEFFVEVKTSFLDLNKAEGTFSRHQISIARNINNQPNKFYLFHFWHLHDNKIRLAEIDVEEMLQDGFSEEKEANLIPEQKIKFKYFKNHFRDIPLDSLTS